MGNAADAEIKMELESANEGYTEMTDSGDHIIYNTSDEMWSKEVDPVIRPNGIATGGTTIVTPAVSGTNDMVDVAAFTFYIAGVEYTHTAETDVTIARDSLACVKTSVCVKAATPTAVDAVAGTDHASATPTTRGADGGPPSIPLVSIEIGQVWYTSTTPAAVLASEIHQLSQANQQERYNYPMWQSPNGIGDGNMADDTDKINAYVEFNAALEVSHGATATSSATACKPIWMDYYTPTMVVLGETTDFVPSDTSYTISSTAIHRGLTKGSSDSSLTATTYTVFTEDNVTDQAVQRRGKNSIVQYYPDMNKAPYMLSQGKVGVKRNEPVSGASRSIDITMADESESVGFDS